MSPKCHYICGGILLVISVVMMASFDSLFNHIMEGVSQILFFMWYFLLLNYSENFSKLTVNFTTGKFYSENTYKYVFCSILIFNK